MKNTHAPFFGIALSALPLLFGCSHPGTGDTGTGGSGQGQGGNGGPTGQGGAGGVTTGAGGGTIVLPPPGSGGGGGGAGNGAGGATVTKVSCTDTSYSSTLPYAPGYPGHATNLAAAQSMLQNLTPADRTAQMRGIPIDTNALTYDVFWQPDNTARSIRGFTFRDGPRGVNMDAPLVTGSQNGKSTAFPQAIARGAAFDLDLEYRIGQAMGDEMVAAGQTMLLAPTVNILRHPSWGRAQETYGEDPFQLGRLGSAFTVGVQEYVGACVKHFAANNVEQGRGTANALMDEQTLREIYARHFGMIIKDGGASCVMASYNKVNGLNSTQNQHLLTDILRSDFGFQGFVLSDWWAMPGGNAPSMLSVDSRRINAMQAVMAGLDMELPWAFQYAELNNITGVDNFVNASALRILEQKIRFKSMALGGTVGLKPATSQLASGS